MGIQRVPPLSDILGGSSARGHTARHNGTRFVSRPSSYIDVRDFGAVPDGNGAGGGTDSTSAIQAAISAATAGQPVYFHVDSPSRRRYNITSTLTCIEGTRLIGEIGALGEGAYPRLEWWGSANSDAIALNAGGAGEVSRFGVQGIGLYNMAGDGTGRGIVANKVRNGVRFHDLLVSGFYDNIFVGGESPGGVSDCIDLRNIWSVIPKRYGLNLTRCYGSVLVENVYCDTHAILSPTAQAVINITGSAASTVFRLANIRHENQIATCDTILIAGSPTVIASGVTMREGSGRDVIRHTGAGQNMVLMGITSDNTAFGDNQTTATNLLNITGGDAAFVIPVSERVIGFWIGGTEFDAPMGGDRFRIGSTSIFAGTVAPESRITANANSLYVRSSGGTAGNQFFIKESGTGTTGWAPVPTKRAATKTFDWPSIADGARSATTVTVTGAALGDTAVASMSIDLQGMEITAHVSATDTVTVVLRNGTGAPIDLASGTLKAVVTKA